MPRYTIVVDRMKDWIGTETGHAVMTADEFLDSPAQNKRAPKRVINLCRHYDYLSAGYYCSLLAEARGQTPMPTVADVLCLQKKSLYAFALAELDAILKRTVRRLAVPPEGAFSLHVFFGRPDDARFKRLAAACFDIFRYPLLRVAVHMKNGVWRIRTIRPMGLHHVGADLMPTMLDALSAYTRARKTLSGGRPPAVYSLAVLVDPDEPLPPSDAGALEKFQRAGQALRMDVALITKRDEKRLVEFDALFIRTTTAIDHFTYQFAKKAEQEGLAVIDDPMSILRCTNKVYLHELLARHGLPAPATRVINRQGFDLKAAERLGAELGYPLVLKIPDGSFSRGMHRCETAQQVLAAGHALLERSRLVLAQEYVYTPHDWRVGVLNGAPLYVCQYKMSRGHWQIINHRPDGQVSQGGWSTVAVADAPAEVVAVAVRAARLIGDGLYGVDVKLTQSGPVVIEVNDNPSLESGVEDKVLKGDLYTAILKDLIRRIDAA